MKRSNSLIADVPPPLPPKSNRPDRPPANFDDPTSAANLAGFFARRQHPHRTHAAISVAPFYVETEAG
jgi:hypothetical protein